MATFQLDIVTPEKTVYSGEIEHFQAPGVDGSFGVLARHQPLLAALGIGLVGLREADGTERTLAISGGFANVSGDGATILAEAAEFDDEIDIERAAPRTRTRTRATGQSHARRRCRTRTNSTRTVIYTAARVGC